MGMELLPGPFMGTIVKHEIGVAKTGNQQLAFTCSVHSEVDDEGSLVKLDRPRTRTVFRTITEKTATRVVKELRLLGYKGTGFSPLDRNSCAEEDFVDMAGTEVPLLNSENNYNGNQNERWDFNFPELGGTITVERAEASAVRGLDAQFASAFDDGEAPPEPPRPAAKPSPSKNGKPSPTGARNKSKPAEPIPF